MFLSHFYKVLLKQMCIIQDFTVHMENFYWIKCFNRKKGKNCAWSKVFLSHFIKFYQNKCVSVSILICARINSTKTLCFGRKKTSKNCAWSKVFLSHFYKVLLKQMCFSQYFNMCMEKFYQNKGVSVQIFHKFYWKKSVSVNILICTCKNCIKHFVSVEKIQQELCLIKSCVCNNFYKVLLKQMCFGEYFNMCIGNILPKQSVSVQSFS